jgi:hypothetical protein
MNWPFGAGAGCGKGGRRVERRRFRRVSDAGRTAPPVLRRRKCAPGEGKDGSAQGEAGRSAVVGGCAGGGVDRRGGAVVHADAGSIRGGVNAGGLPGTRWSAGLDAGESGWAARSGSGWVRGAAGGAGSVAGLSGPETYRHAAGAGPSGGQGRPAFAGTSRAAADGRRPAACRCCRRGSWRGWFPPADCRRGVTAAWKNATLSRFAVRGGDRAAAVAAAGALRHPPGGRNALSHWLGGFWLDWGGSGGRWGAVCACAAAVAAAGALRHPPGRSPALTTLVAS